MEIYITLSKNQYFQVVSKVTNRTLTVTGFGIKDDRVVEYAIHNEGWWDATRFEKIETIHEKVERLEIENLQLKKQNEKLKKEVMEGRFDKIEKKLEQIDKILDNKIIKINF